MAATAQRVPEFLDGGTCAAGVHRLEVVTHRRVVEPLECAGVHHTLALTNDGAVVGWGDDPYGQATAPVGLSGVVAVAAGLYHSLTLNSDGMVTGWGSGSGQATSPAAPSKNTGGSHGCERN